MKKHIFILSLIFILSCSAFAQTEQPKDEKTKCPEISLIGPPSVLNKGDTATFTVVILGDDDDIKNPKIEWKVIGGKILSGQGKTTIRMEISEDSDETFYAEVSVETQTGCVLTARETGFFGDPPQPVLIDDFGNLTNGNVKARLDAFMADLLNNEGSQGYIVNYGSKRQIARRVKGIKNHLNYRSYDLANIVFVNGSKSKEVRTKFWRVPAGADTSTID